MQKVLIFVTLFSSTVFASSDFSQYESAFLEVVRTDSNYDKEERQNYPWWAKSFLANWLRYNPNTGNSLRAQPCDPQNWKDSLSAAMVFSDISGSIEKYVELCEKHFQLPSSNILLNSYRTMMLDLQTKQHPYSQYVVFHLPNGVKVKGLLAIKGDGKRRPFVIIRSGIFSNATQFFPERYLFMQLFEQSQFNALLLESNSGYEFIHRNKELLIGGFDEGIHDFLIAQGLKNAKEPISRIIESIHLVAISMGGHGALFASMLNSEQKNPAINSVLTFCPLVSFKDSLDYHLSEGVFDSRVNYWLGRRLDGIEQDIAGIVKDDFTKSIVDYLQKNFSIKKYSSLNLKFPNFIQQLPDTYWGKNDFMRQYKDVTTPVLVFATKRDPMVPYTLNSQRLKNKYFNVENSNLKVIELAEGYHCSLPGAYLWNVFTTISQQYIENFSHLQLKEYERKFALTEDEAERLKLQGLQFGYDLRPGRSDSQREVFVYFNKNKSIKRSFFVELNELGFAASEFESSQKLLLRWLEQQVSIRLQEKQIFIQWRS